MILSRKTLLLNKSQNNIFLICDPIPNVDVYPDGDSVKYTILYYPSMFQTIYPHGLQYMNCFG